MAIIVVVDVGNFSTKYAYQDEKEIKSNSFPSYLHQYKELENVEGMQRIQYNNLDYFAGEKVKAFYFGREEQMYFGNTKKGHHEAQIRLVYALYNVYKETGMNEFNLILTCPYESMEVDKKYFTSNFEGKREAQIDNETFKFSVNRIIMAAEGLGAFHFSKSPNCVIIDAGSMTLNILYLINGSISREDSHTLNGGTIHNSVFQLASTFAKTCTNVDYDYPIICTGGKAKEMKEVLEQLGYSEVSIADLRNQPTYYVNSVGLLMKYGKKFEEMFSWDVDRTPSYIK